MDLMNLIQSQIGDAIMNQITPQVSGNREQTASATNSIIQALIGAMAKNANSESGAASLFNAIDRDHTNNGLLDNVDDFLNPNKPNPVDNRAANGMGIISHLLGPKAGAIAQLIGQQNNLNTNDVFSMMVKYAPLVMSFMGKQKQEGGMGIADLAGLLNNQRQHIDQRTQQEQGGLGDLMKIIDFDGDGSGMDDAMSLISKFLR